MPRSLRLSRALFRGLLLGTAVLAHPAQAQTATDRFSGIPQAPLNGQGGGTGWLGPWTGDAAIVLENPLRDPAGKLPAGGHSVGVRAAVGQYLTNERRTDFEFGRPSTTEWLSFTIVRVFGSPGPANPPPYGGLALGGPRGLTIGDLGDGRWGMDTSGPPALDRVVDAGPVTDNVPVFLVVRADFREDETRFTLYENPTPGLPAPDAPGVVKADLLLGQTDRVQIVYGNGNAYILGPIRLGRTFAAVAPGAAPAAPSSAPDHRQELQAAYAARNAALGRKDAAAVLATQTASFVQVDATGKAHPAVPAAARRDLTALFHANRTLQEVTAVDAVTPDASGAGATVTARDILSALPLTGPGVRTDSTVRDFWVLRDGVWRLSRRRVLTARRSKIVSLFPAVGTTP